ncbi:MAG TPA: MBL fold metallo-hydrolase [Jatrophihabitans sp.]|jgi:glyoxylase-like metal-dependent hydrolase (beta-lactamase superfamily II)|nr:MBL fold metallo-hydrolase [Jatrophihabitans sp.]
MIWHEVADGIFQGRYEPWDVNVCVVRGTAGLLVVDTRASHRQADELRADLARLGSPRWVVNTHAHFDHSFGNHRFGPASDLGLPIYGHVRVPAHLDRYERPLLDRWIASGEGPVDELREVIITAPTELVDEQLSLDLGDRLVELRHIGRGHTDNDLVLHAPDADTWLVGDLVEESGPPMYGSGCFPLEWGATAHALVKAIDPAATVVPGHGRSVDRDFVARQAGDLSSVAELLREVHANGAAASDAVGAAAGRWPFPEDGLQPAVDAAYAELG